MWERLRHVMSPETFKKLELFFANTDLDEMQRMRLAEIVLAAQIEARS